MNPILTTLADNPALCEAFKALFLKHLNADTTDPGMTNEVLGQITRSRMDGLRVLENTFKEVERCKTVERKPQGLNPAR